MAKLQQSVAIYLRNFFGDFLICLHKSAAAGSLVYQKWLRMCTWYLLHDQPSLSACGQKFTVKSVEHIDA